MSEEKQIEENGEEILYGGPREGGKRHAEKLREERRREMSEEQKRDELTEIIIKASEEWLKLYGRQHLHLEHKAEHIAAAVNNAGYRKQSEKYLVKENGDIEPLKKQIKWISVEERLPDICGMEVLMVAVNCYGQTNIVKGFTDYQCPIKFLTNEKQYDNIWGAWDVTHWMPLPEAPKGGEQK